MWRYEFTITDNEDLEINKIISMAREAVFMQLELEDEPYEYFKLYLRSLGTSVPEEKHYYFLATKEY